MAKAASRWGRVSGVIADAVAQVAHPTGRPKRLSAALRDAIERSRVAAAARPRDATRTAPRCLTADPPILSGFGRRIKAKTRLA